MKIFQHFILLFILLIFKITLAQNSIQNPLFTDITAIDRYIHEQDKGMVYESGDEIKGTPYYNEKYSEGSIYKGDTLIAEKVAIRFNVYGDEMEIKKHLYTPNDKAQALAKDSDIFVKIEDQIFAFAPFNGNIEEGTYFQILFEGTKFGLHKKINKEFIARKTASTSQTRDVPAEFKDSFIYFIVSKSGKFYELPPNKKLFVEVFGKRKEVVKDYIKNNKLKISDEEDLIQIIQHVDGLSSSTN